MPLSEREQEQRRLAIADEVRGRAARDGHPNGIASFLNVATDLIIDLQYRVEQLEEELRTRTPELPITQTDPNEKRDRG